MEASVKETSKRPSFSREIIQEIRRLHRRDNWHGWIAIGSDWFQILITVSVLMILPSYLPLAATVALTLLGLIVIASRQRALEHLLHEASHGNLFKNPRLNRWVTLWFIAYPTFHSLEEYSRSHMIHHRDLGHDHDPDFIAYQKLNIDQLPVPTRQFFWYYVVWNGLRVPFMQIPDFLRRITGLFAEPWSHRLGRYAFLAAWVGILLQTGWLTTFLLLWILPQTLILPILRYFGEMSKHAALIDNETILTMTRNRFPHPVEKYLMSAHHDNYHLVHHLFPTIPFYHLSQAHKALMHDPRYAAAHHCDGYICLEPKFEHSITDELTLSSQEIQKGVLYE
ncbi:fatty acid desaturase family protein [Desmospora profundinema]|uniref:Fatty acid desaturase n=1 Tax=Desmospora profundinema TaxID=1571184 RepID=A0ABU1IPZ2_9BACL|nr:fatty acid desaturase family protein [Desmospora profundinema]MDR6226808.1 fatty acid desaturase [Desmospora profundinema]